MTSVKPPTKLWDPGSDTIDDLACDIIVTQVFQLSQQVLLGATPFPLFVTDGFTASSCSKHWAKGMTSCVCWPTGW